MTLAGASLVAAHVAHTDAGPDRVRRRSTSSSDAVTITPQSGASRMGTLRALVPAGGECVDRPAPDPQLQCMLDGVSVEYALAGSQRATEVYRSVVADSTVSRLGPAACASGGTDERAWSRPEDPITPVGRYACAVDGGRAAMWWTVSADGLIAHAVAPDADLAALFAWWRTHGERMPPR